MSEVPDRRSKSSVHSSGATPTRKRKAGTASFRYGYRDVPKRLPDGTYDVVRIPLTLEDVLHPKMGDVHMLGDPHDEDCHYLKTVLKDRFAYDASFVVFSDCGIYWDIPGLRHHSPDLSVIFGVKERKDWETFHVKVEKVRPSLIVEVTSPRTRVNDVKKKVIQYARAGVPHYVIADVRKQRGIRRLTLIRYELKEGKYRSMGTDSDGRVWLEPVGLWLGVRVDPDTGSDRLVLIEPETNEPIGDYTAVNRARALAAEQARAATQKAEAESKARLAAEARIRELEAELQRAKRGKRTE
jgi:colicin import membrane protein